MALPDDDAGPRDGGTEPLDLGTSDTDAGGTLDGGPIVIDAGGPVDGYPDVPRAHVGHPDWNLLTLVSHNLVQSPTTDFEELLLIVRNDNPTTTFCSITSRVEFFDASGTSITWRTGTFDGEPRRVYSVDVGCIPPGGFGLGYANSSWSLNVADVARIEYTFGGSGGSGADVQLIANVTDEGQTIADPYGSGTYWGLEGTLRVTSGSIRNPDVTVFPIDARGLPYDSLGAIELITLSAGSSWPYTTTSAEPRFFEYFIAHSYRGTTAPIVIDSPEARTTLTQRERYDTLRDEARTRRIHRL